ncbi:hypothetical protein GCM10027294_47390 [Marinactinospora endophytica]
MNGRFPRPAITAGPRFSWHRCPELLHRVLDQSAGPLRLRAAVRLMPLSTRPASHIAPLTTGDIPQDTNGQALVRPGGPPALVPVPPPTCRSRPGISGPT